MPVLYSLKEILLHLFVPRNSNNQRSKILHPAGLAILVGFFLLSYSLRFLVNRIPGVVLGFTSSVTSEEVIAQTNRERSQAGLSALTQNPQLTQAAFAKAQDMFAQNYWAHISPTGTQPWQFIRNQGYKYQYAGENLARDFSNTAELMNAWMGSSSHKENIVNPKYTDIGVAVLDGTLEGIETRLVVQMFAAPATASVATAHAQNPPQTAVVIPQKAAQEVNQLPAAPVTPLPTVPALEESDFGKVVPEPKVQFSGTKLLQGKVSVITDQKIVSPTQISQIFGIILMFLILGSLMLDWAMAHRKKAVRLVGKNWAHLSFLAAMLLMLLQFTQGNIL